MVMRDLEGSKRIPWSWQANEGKSSTPSMQVPRPRCIKPAVLSVLAPIHLLVPNSTSRPLHSHLQTPCTSPRSSWVSSPSPPTSSAPPSPLPRLTRASQAAAPRATTYPNSSSTNGPSPSSPRADKARMTVARRISKVWPTRGASLRHGSVFSSRVKDSRSRSMLGRCAALIRSRG
ncbi:hypothetical protein BDV95DRAFT_567446 [Massariosphaeria phaeospora]|uniref:Uncharacterized protein n=1 Tax=Massariosphaeria phaeospora TaxID=100035 RepID=A0A7C8IGH2_9PLEO|nr:hypothetical protein BDV95DRAFT_567446 [Massariosphaeria phaeospora]